MYFSGLIIAVFAFVIIGLFHPIVIKAEYYFSKKCWPVFLLAGLLFLIFSLLTAHTTCSALLGVTGCVCLWSILELHHQEARVKKGWFPSNPNRR